MIQNTKYSGDLNRKLVWHSDHRDLFDRGMVGSTSTDAQ